MVIPILAGRTSEIAAILAELESVRERAAVGSVLIRGPGGIGKSRLIETVLQHADHLGSAAILGRAESFDRGIPLGVIRDAVDSFDPSAMAPQAGTVLTELRDALGVRRDEHAEGNLVRQLDLVVGLMAELLALVSQHNPAVVVLDDLHLADPESISLYGLLARQLVGTPVLFLLTARPGFHGLRDLESFVERLTAQGRAAVLDVQPLPAPAVAELVGSILSHPPAVELAAHITEQSVGNPFFARELTLQLVADQTILVRNGRAHLDPARSTPAPGKPRTLTERFFADDSDEAKAATAMSIFGRFNVSQLPLIAALTGMDLGSVAVCCDRLVASQLLTRVSQGFEFAHPLLKTSLYRQMSPAQRTVMHASVATRLSADAAAGWDVDPFELATHVSASAAIGDEKALAVLLAAARLAMQDVPLVAAEWFARALALMAPDSPAATGIQSEHTFAYIFASQSRQAVATGLAALRSAPAGRARSGLVFATVNALFANGRIQEAVDLINEQEMTEQELAQQEVTEQEVTEQESDQKDHSGESADTGDDVALLAFKVSLLTQLGQLRTAGELYSRARVLLERAPTDPLKFITTYVQLYCYAQVTGLAADCNDLESRIRRAIPLCPPAVQAEFHHFLAVIPGFNPGAVDLAENDLRTAKNLRGGVTSVSAGGNAENAQLMINWLRGRWDEAMRSVPDAIELLENNGNHTTVSSLRGCSAMILTDQGEYVRAAELMGAPRPEPTAAQAMLTVSRARIELNIGDRDVAVDLLAQYCRRARQAGSLSFYALVAEEWALAEVARGNLDEAIFIAEETSRLLTDVPWPLADLYALRLRAAVLGDRSAGAAALAIAEAERMPVEVAKCLVVLGESGTVEVSEALRAYEIFSTVKATPWVRRTNRLLRSLGRAAPRRRQTPDLTPIELSLISLVVQGMTNRQIASTLKYSTKTVELYLSRLYAKTGVQSRIDLARASLQGQLDLAGSPDSQTHHESTSRPGV